MVRTVLISLPFLAACGGSSSGNKDTSGSGHTGDSGWYDTGYGTGGDGGGGDESCTSADYMLASVTPGDLMVPLEFFGDSRDPDTRPDYAGASATFCNDTGVPAVISLLPEEGNTWSSDAVAGDCEINPTYGAGFAYGVSSFEDAVNWVSVGTTFELAAGEGLTLVATTSVDTDCSQYGVDGPNDALLTVGLSYE